MSEARLAGVLHGILLHCRGHADLGYILSLRGECLSLLEKAVEEGYAEVIQGGGIEVTRKGRELVRKYHPRYEEDACLYRDLRHYILRR